MTENKRIKESTQGQILDSGKIGGPFQRGQVIPHLKSRLDIFDRAKKRYDEAVEKNEHANIVISYQEQRFEGKAFLTTPEQIAKKISKNLVEKSCVAKVFYESRFELYKVSTADNDDEDFDLTDASESQQTKAEFWDMHKPLEGSCKIEFFDFESTEGKSAFWHSSAHILGQAIEQYYGSFLCIGPPLQKGFYYDSYIGQESVHPEDFEKIEKIMDQIVKDKQSFDRAVLTKEEALEMFKENPFKVQLIKNKVPDGGYTSAYRSGSLVDLCTGPHLQNTSRVKAIKITKNSSAYWLGKNTNDDLQRIYAISFPQKKQLDDWVKKEEELAKRDHRTIGKQYELFQFHHFAPGCAFWFPHGAHIYTKLTNLMRAQYQIRGYQEVISPNLYDSNLWKVSGHWAQYQENMFLVKGVSGDEGSIHGLKPMNCPGHCLMFDMKQISYRELPLRYADFGVLHRNEVHGALSGLTRVRRFQQDDAHIFCRVDQIEQEILGCLDFIDYIYSLFGFKYELGLSTRPKNHLGEEELWDNSERMIEDALKKFASKTGKKYKINKGDGAFYGPKIDIDLYDAFDRSHQCGTVQLDFNLPIRFNLQYRNDDTLEQREKTQKQKGKGDKAEDVPLFEKEKQILQQLENQEEPADVPQGSKDVKLVQDMKGVLKSSHKHQNADDGSVEGEHAIQRKESHVSHESDHKKSEEHQKKYTLQPHELKTGFSRPVIVHRAVLGSVERFIAILCEQTAGKWPFWLSPRQIQIIPISKDQLQFAQKVVNRIVFEGFIAHVDDSSHTISKKIRNAETMQYNYIGVIGKDEVNNGYIDVRARGGEQLGKMTTRELCNLFKSLDPPMSNEERILRENSFFREKVEEFEELNEKLLSSQFLSGHKVNEKDREVFGQLVGRVIDHAKYPHLWRWFQCMEANKEKDLEEINQILLKKMFLDGNRKSDEDDRVYQRIKDLQIDEFKYPNINRWKNYMASEQ